VPNLRVITGVDPVNAMTAGHPVGMTAGLNAVMTADPVTDPGMVLEMVPEMKDPGKVELGNLAEVEVLGVTAKNKESNNGRQMTVDPVAEMTVDPGVVMTVDPGVAMTVDPEGVMVVVEVGVMLPVRIAVLNAEMIAGMIAGLHLCAVMTAVKTAGAVAEVGVVHPVPNPAEMTAAPLCVAMTAVDPVTDPGVEMIVHPCAAEVTGMVPGMPLVGMTAGDPGMLVVKTIGVQDLEGFQLRPPVGMTAGLDSLLRRTHPQSVPPLSL